MTKKYNIHHLLLSSTAKKIRKHEKEFKNKSDEETVGRIISFQPEFVNTLDFAIMSEESYWKESGSNIIFPDGEDMLSKLYSAKFDIEGNAGFDLPFDSFVFGIPQGYEVDGQKIPPFIVTCLEYKEHQDIIIHPFSKKCKIPPVNIIPDPKTTGKKIFSIAYQDPFSPCTVHIMKTVDDLSKILNASTPEEYEQVIKYTQHKENVIKLDDQDLSLQFKIIKLVASLGVYHVATNGERLEKGFPSTGAFKIDKPASLLPTVHSYNLPKVNKDRSTNEHVRGWVFRQLRHEKYYKGEYKHLAKGSRWTFIDACTIGIKSKMHTQK
jgi:hypothetical protein